MRTVRDIARVVAATIRDAPILSDAYPHLEIPDLLPADFYAEVLEGVPQSSDLERCEYPGTAIDLETPGAQAYGLRVRKTVRWSALGVLRRSFRHPVVSEALLSRFSSIEVGGIPAEKRHHFEGGVRDFRVVENVYRDLPGYEISPHRDVDEKIVTFLLYLEPDDALADWGTHLCVPAEGQSVDDVVSAPGHHGQDQWRDWSLFDVAKTAAALPNNFLAFAPHERSFHAVRLDIPQQQSRRERTALRGFIRAGRSQNDWTTPIRTSGPLVAQHPEDDGDGPFLSLIHI